MGCPHIEIPIAIAFACLISHVEKVVPGTSSIESKKERVRT